MIMTFSLSSKILVFMTLLFMIVQLAHAEGESFAQGQEESQSDCSDSLFSSFFSDCQGLYDECSKCLQDRITRCKSDLKHLNQDTSACYLCATESKSKAHCGRICSNDIDCARDNMCFNNKCIPIS